jgi:hypothetical protein
MSRKDNLKTYNVYHSIQLVLEAGVSSSTNKEFYRSLVSYIAWKTILKRETAQVCTS